MEYKMFEFPEGKTSYQIIDEDGQKTTISLEKWVADVLQLELEDVHAKVQAAYNRVLEKHPELSRRLRGNYIRQMAEATANKFQASKKKVLGWNDEDFDLIF
jgi:hypothetical protein